MHNSRLTNLFIQAAGVTWLLLAACAQIVNPTGGDKDFNAPEVTGVTPENNSTNFNRKKITIHFSEFIQLNTPEDLIIISPPLEIKPTYINKGKAMEIRFNSLPLANTTYNINFGTAIGDNKENNLLKNFNYSFSTGPYLDSGSVHGHVTHSFTNKPEKDITVALYYTDSFTDSTILKKKPIYLSKTDDNGDFKLMNLPTRLFRLVAFRDENKNLKADKTEDLAFTESLVNPSDTFNRIALRTFKPNVFTPGKITDTFNRQPNKFVFVTYKSAVPQIINRNGKPVYTDRLKGTESDTLYVFTPMDAGDTAAQFLVNEKNVTVKYKPIFKSDKLSITFNKQPELQDTLVLHSNNPILFADTSRIKLFKDSFQVKPGYVLSNAFEYRIVYPWNEKTSYKLELADSAFRDLFGQYNKKDKASFFTKGIKDYGTLLLHVKLKKRVSGQIILQFTDEGEKNIYREFVLNSSRDLNIEYILPASYRIKYIYDTNSNGKWDNGDFSTKTQPEQVGYFNEMLNIKAYWDLEQSILIE